MTKAVQQYFLMNEKNYSSQKIFKTRRLNCSLNCTPPAIYSENKTFSQSLDDLITYIISV